VSDIGVDGSSVYVGGYFDNVAGNRHADMIARWNGARWSAVGSRGVNGSLVTGEVKSILIDGTSVYVGGSFTEADRIRDADYIARWDGQRWRAVGSNKNGNDLSAPVLALAKTSAGLWVGGAFRDAAGLKRADRVAIWRSGRWRAVGSNGSGNGALNDTVRAFARAGGAVYVGGSFRDAARIPQADRVARWGVGG
jgi:hypothetical protein